MTKPTITICMGSSCFARGNEAMLEVIEEFLAGRDLADQVDVVGVRCEGNCSCGPNVRINDVLYQHLDRGVLTDLLEEQFGNGVMGG